VPDAVGEKVVRAAEEFVSPLPVQEGGNPFLGSVTEQRQVDDEVGRDAWNRPRLEVLERGSEHAPSFERQPSSG
jgi:hypothetical protein